MQHDNWDRIPKFHVIAGPSLDTWADQPIGVCSDQLWPYGIAQLRYDRTLGFFPEVSLGQCQLAARTLLAVMPDTARAMPHWQRMKADLAGTPGPHIKEPAGTGIVLKGDAGGG